MLSLFGNLPLLKVLHTQANNMKTLYLLLLLLFLGNMKGWAQCTGGIITASNHDIYYGVYDTICVGACQHFWIVNADCPEFTGADFYWIFYATNKNDTIVGDTVSYCFPDTGAFRMDVYAYAVDWNNANNLGTKNVVIPCSPNADFTADRQKICSNESVRFTDKSTGLVSNWQWTFSGGNPSAYTGKYPPPVFYSDTGLFTVTLDAINAFGSGSTMKTSFIHVLAAPEPYAVETEFEVREGDEITLHTCADGSSYSWLPPVSIIQNSDTLITVQPESTQRYVAVVKNENGCATTCDYTVFVQSGLLLPTAFTPNGDGFNDVFRILNTNIKLLNFSIYNRWGEMVFSTTDITEGWDGVYKDVPQPMSTFVWTCEYVITKTGKRKSAKGNVTLLR